MSASRRLVSGCLAALALECARTAGLDHEPLMRRAGIQIADLTDPDASIPLAKYVDLWRIIAEDPRGRTAGLRSLEIVRLSNLGALGYAFRNAETVGHALSLMIRHARVLGEVLAPEIRLDDQRVTIARRWPDELGHNRPFVEAGFGNMMGTLREITGARQIPIEVGCQFSRPADAHSTEATLGCGIRYDHPETFIAFPGALARQPVANRDPALFAIVNRHAEHLAGTRVDTGTLADDARVVLRAQLASGEMSLAVLARKLGMSGRTLQRRLAEENVSLSGLLDETRRELSLRYLDDPMLGLSTIAFMLGYAEETSFQRAFRRWTGEAPATYRRRRRSVP